MATRLLRGLESAVRGPVRAPRGWPAQRRWRVNDWQRRGLRAPPRGYYWVRENNNSGDYLLVAASTGLIASILASQ